jgi:hypothetical protein
VLIRNNYSILRNVTNSIFKKVKEKTNIVGWKTKTSSEKKLSIINLTENKYPEDQIDEMTLKVID